MFTFIIGILKMILPGVGEWLSSRNNREIAQIDAKKQIDTTAIKVEGEVAVARFAFMSGNFWYGLAYPLITVPTAIYYLLIIADSIYPFSWNIQALPKPMDEWAGWIVLAVVGISAYKKLTK